MILEPALRRNRPNCDSTRSDNAFHDASSMLRIAIERGADAQ
jgi:hypothetical protein